MPNLYIIAGCNGAGKTTASYTILPEILDCKEFVNADKIAEGISPFNAEKIALEAGRIMLNRVRDLMQRGEDFAFETTLSTKSYAALIRDAKAMGYTVSLLYFWLATPYVAIERVHDRVRRGGHSIPDETVIRRYQGGLKNFFSIYQPICDSWIMINNMYPSPIVIAEGNLGVEQNVLDKVLWNKIRTRWK
ncbi:zeta toxin family protein [Dyadobacter sp. CY261]|uniref:zeta toxin family protein n=1 Tax=Dyadobacter sp. CY261 TaxID=2907203 RepID=UPI001F0321F1|nr:zeta toxin family protein [Dyadobacter sp. CY261]MCF0068917.1 zeta toxin family protein [Dyadobacter sp. CY261]